MNPTVITVSYREQVKACNHSLIQRTDKSVINLNLQELGSLKLRTQGAMIKKGEDCIS